MVLTNDGCAPEPASVTPGKITFEVQNKDATKVTEGELKSGDLKHILAEKENLTPGLGADFTLNLEAGEYKVYCPGAKQDTWDFTVKGAQTTASWKSNPQLVAAVNGYAAWIKQEVAKFAANTQAFAAAVKAGNVEEAKALYAKARLGYESVEPAAEAFGDLDRDIDGRIDDFPQKSKFQGFHRLEQALFVDNNVTGLSPIADRLVTDVGKLQTLGKTQTYSPLELASGATDLVNEIEQSKITGEEERYSGVDLVDFQGNLTGAMEIVKELTPYLQEHDPALLAKINSRYQAVETALAKYKADPGYVDSGFVKYTTVTDPERRALSLVVNALAESVSELVVVVSR